MSDILLHGLARNERAFRIPSGGDYAASRGNAALIGQHLGSREYLELDRPTPADVAVYPVVALVPEAGLPVGDYSATLGWIDRLAVAPALIDSIFALPLELPCGATLSNRLVKRR